MDLLEPYKIAILALGLLGLLYWLQLAFVDWVAMRSGKTPGYTIEQNHKSFAFRSYRALANSNESATIFTLAVAFSILSSANPEWLNSSVVVYLLSRLGHMVFYYFNVSLCRSLSFAISFVALLAILGTGFWAWV